MEALALLFGLGVFGVVIVIPVVAIATAFRASRHATQASQHLDAARFRLDAAEHTLSALAGRLWQLESQVASMIPSPPRDDAQTRAATSTNALVPEPAPDTTTQLRVGRDFADAPVDPAPTIEQKDSDAESKSAEFPNRTDPPISFEPPTPTPIPSVNEEHSFSEPSSQLNWEGLVGVRLFAWLGGGALFLGAALFLHYSIQQDLISPSVRVALGLISGVLLLAGGDRLRLKANMASHAIMGGGVGILYAALYASHSLYHLIPTPVAFGGMALVTVTAGVTSIRRNAYVLAVLGLLGGMATPFLLSTGEDRPWSLLGYVLFLDLGITWVSKKREWPTLALLGFCSSLLVFIAWCTEYLYSSRVPYALGAIALVAALFASMIRFRRADAREVDSTIRTTAQFAVATPLLVAVVLVCHPNLSVDPTFLTAYLALMAFGSTWVAHCIDAAYLPVSVALIGLFAQALRTHGDMFPAHAVTTLAGFSILPLAHAVLAWWKRQTSFAAIHRWALAIVLASPVALASLAGNFNPPNAHHWLGLYTAIHVLGLLYLAFRYGEPKFFAIGQGVTWVVALSLRATGGTSMTDAWSIWLAVGALVFWALPLVVASLQNSLLTLGVSALTLPVNFALLYGFAQNDWGSGPLGLLSVTGSLLMVVGLSRVRLLLCQNEHARSTALALHGAMCLAFLTTALPILLEKQWLTVAFGLEVAALAWLRRRVAHDGLVLFAAALAFIAFSRLVFNSWLWHYQPRSGIPILNFYLYTFGLVAVSFMVASKLLRANAFSAKFKLGMCLNWAAVVLWFVLVNVEVADCFSTGPGLVFRYFGGGLAQDMAYSLSWGGFALVLMALGIVRDVRSLRLGALLFLSLTVGKVFLHDLWQLGALYRVGSVVGLAVALLAVSFLVQRFILRGGKA